MAKSAEDKFVRGKDLTTVGSEVKSKLSLKQDNIADLQTIRSGAALGATALQYTPVGEIDPSITPADYATREELNLCATKAEVNQLGQEFSELKGPFSLPFITGQYISIPAEGSAIGNPTTSAAYNYARINVTPGDTATIRGAGGNGPRLWAFVDATEKVLSRAEAGVDTRNNPAVLTIPANAAELIVNVNNSAVYSATYETQSNLQKEFAERDEKIVLVGQEISGLNVDVNSFRIDGPVGSSYNNVYDGRIPVGSVIVNKSGYNIGLWLVGASNYVSIKNNRSYVLTTTPGVKIQLLGHPIDDSGYISIIGRNDTKLAMIRPVESLLNQGKNLFNPNAEDIVIGATLTTGGGTSPNDSYNVSGWIRVKENTTYVFSRGGVASNVRSLCVYNADKIVIDALTSDNVNSITTTDGCCFLRFFVAKNVFASYQLEEAETPTAYSPFEEKIKPSLLPTIVPNIGAMNAIQMSGTLANGQSLSTPICIYKNIMLSAKVTGTIASVLMGLGINGYYGRWIEVTQTQIILYDRNGQHSSPRTHGLTLGEFTTIELSKDDNTGNFKARIINDYGALYEWDMQNIGLAGGNPAIVNNGTQSIQAKFVIFPRDLSAKIWGFGDSYFSFQDSARWTYYAINWGYDKWLLNALGGEASPAAYTNFETLFATGARPEYILWCMGMNDGADTTTPNANWLTAVQNLIQTCEENGITPILATIPSIPSKSHAQKNNWVRNSGKRYVDFAAYVEASNNNYWRGWGTADALLSSDETHPTQAGAKTLWQAVLNDFPEIATNY